MPAHQSFEARLDLLAQEPGVYLMKDATGSVIYVGKALNLPKRLRSYFCPNPRGTAKVLAMISHIADFETITCANELEALILENNLIKRYQPRYNILLRDDKEYPYIRVTLNEAYPRVLKSFHIGPDQQQGARYYGPYEAGDLHRALKAIYDIFPLKTCRRVFPRDIGKERPCLAYHIGRCIAPCLGTVSQAEYRALVDELCRFLDGHGEALVQRLTADMQAASERLDFEHAALYRDRLQALEQLRRRQNIVSPERKDVLDVLHLARNGSEFCVEVLKVREGRLLGASPFFFKDEGEEPDEILESFILQYYHEAAQVPDSLIVPVLPASAELLAEALRSLRGKKVELHAAQRGHKAELLRMAERNARQSLERHTLMGGTATALLMTLQLLGEELGIEAPQRIEAIDIANTGAEDRVAALVVFEDGRPKRSAYRVFKIKSFEGIDDYRSMHEALERRLAHLDDPQFGRRPDLILLDGGKGHVATMAPLLQAAGIPYGGMVKDDRHRTRGLVRPDGSILELRAEDPGEGAEARAKRLGLLRLLTALQDEAHRFAGRQQKNLQKKRSLRYSLESIPGIGPERRKALYKAFGSLKAIREATPEVLRSNGGLSEKLAAAVYAHFHPQAEALNEEEV